MRQRTSTFLALAIALVIVALFSVAPFALGSPAGQQDATDQQATINALVQERFTLTAQASGPSLTATAEAGMTATAQAQATQGAALALTVDAAFNQALTATAGGPAEQPATATSQPVTEGEALGYRIGLAPVTPVEAETLQETAAIVQNRLEALGLSAVVTLSDTGTIQVEMTAPEDLNATLSSIQEAGLLEFVDFSGQMSQLNDLADDVIATSYDPARDNGTLNPLTERPFDTVLTGDDIASAQVVELAGGVWGVQFDFTEAGGQTMVDFTRSHVGEPLAILIDGAILSTPIIQSEFGAQGGLLQGNFSQEEAERLALQLNLGSLPVGLEVVSTEALAALPETVALIPTVTETPAPTNTPAPTGTPDPRPTATTGRISVAEEVFENGRMFYIQPLDQIWVMVITGEGHGDWSIYPDTFEEGDAEVDPSLVPPDGMYQPERGFGKLWRDNPEVREALGWAVTPEFGYESSYRYQPGGEMVNGQFVPGPGYHVLFSLAGEAFQFNEDDNTWQFHNQD
jgi:hypothetical protein